jgi:hypothetical protein
MPLTTRTGRFTVAGVPLDFDTLADKTPRDQPSDVNLHPIPGGNVTFVDLGGQRPQQNKIGILCLTDAEFAALEAVVNSTGTLEMQLDGVWSAVLRGTHRVKRWASGEVEGELMRYLDRELDKDAVPDERGLSTRVSDWFIASYMARLGLPVLPSVDDPS